MQSRPVGAVRNVRVQVPFSGSHNFHHRRDMEEGEK
jgi:hypothetical protein